MRKQKLVLIGNGMAGVRTVEELLKFDPELYDITIFGAEPHPNYNRILLSPVLAGEQTLEQIVLNDLAWYETNGIHLHLNKKVVKIDRKERTVTTDDGIIESYDKLLLATGSLPFILPVPGNNLPGVIAYRDIKDTNEMIDVATRYKNAVVIGGGLLGLEAANGLALRGMSVTVVHLAPWLMERQLDQVAADLLQSSLEEKGLRFLLSTSTEAILPNAAGDRVGAIRFKGGLEIQADLVVMAAGIKPNTALAESAGLYCNRGIVVNDTMQTFDPRVYAVGECASHRGIAYGLVAPLFEQAKVCANHLAEIGINVYTGSVTSTKLKVTGVDLFSTGKFMGGEGTEEITLADPIGGVYKKLVIQDDRLVGACMFGDTSDSTWYFKLMRDAKNISEIRDSLMFGESNIGDVGHQGHNKAAGMNDADEVCGCNGVTKGTIVKAIREQGLFTLDEVKKCTKASSSCGSCTGLVEQVLMNVLGTDYSATPRKKSICGCSEHSHEEIREAIRAKHLISQDQVRTELNWRTPNGCATCRPALNYYLISTWPHEAQDDPQSRFINERAHANIQKDGTYSVVPRMYGGLTTPAELRRIADVAEKYKVPTVKVTGGQRIDLLGIKKDDLPAVWKELDMPSGHAYGKSIRTVKTCVGDEHCRFGTQSSMKMGVDLERMLFGMYSPHKVKLAVSGCPRNCAEAGIKDVGIIGVESGWELYIGGNGGIKTEVAEFLCKVKTDEEVREYSGAFLQLYREEAWYLDRTVHYLARVGMDYIKQKVVDDAQSRKALYERLLFDLKDAPDPWKDFEQAKVDIRQFKTIPIVEVNNVE
ncbi:nitrite reductase large subunit NirB [Polynucleobacter kasalickyi]|uniref:Assimilatory nitrite reductase (NAD(P)H) large subunit n=1 Tax=Polynucleobacter kasalickyi TaxID=1938817 RepID=A0A1W1Y2Y6_9BURK|nr:nitrite reductase large subunit NirB [Polynucleobacter kasalickyi]SMC30590.1 assimilatory nitrite reductase (NAD(P)H) large subunit precursor [Polynucleobacter kasalickyi]